VSRIPPTAGGRTSWRTGPARPSLGFFDIDWDPPKADLKNKVLLPVLGDQYGKVLENQEIKITYEGGTFALHFYEFALPVAPAPGPWFWNPRWRSLDL
jgi:maltooligosyltrehalose synthase